MVRREDEQDVGLLLQAVHFVEEFVQHNFFARAVHFRSFSGDEIDIFHDDNARLKQTGKNHVLREQADLFSRDQKSRVAFQRLGEVVDCMSLARTGRAVKEDSLLGRLLEPSQLRTMPNKLDDISVEQGKRLYGQNHLLPLNGAQLMHG